MSFAIVDAAAGVEARACGCVGRSRYSIPIANLPLIYHVFDELAAAGIDRVQMIVSPSAARGARAGSRRRAPMGSRGRLHDRPRARRPRGRPGRGRAGHLRGAGTAVPRRLPVPRAGVGDVAALPQRRCGRRRARFGQWRGSPRPQRGGGTVAARLLGPRDRLWRTRSRAAAKPGLRPPRPRGLAPHQRLPRRRMRARTPTGATARRPKSS